MTWQYCRKCGTEMDEPTVEEVCEQVQRCPDCQAEHDPLKSLATLVGELADRVKALEDQSRRGV